MPRTATAIALVLSGLTGTAWADRVSTPAQKPRGVVKALDLQTADQSLERPVRYSKAADGSSIAHAAAYIIYMNRDGGTFVPGNNDSRTNRSSIPAQTSQILPWNVSDAGWQQVMDCVRDIYAPFDIEITDVDPGNVAHMESVVAGFPQDVGMENGVGGVSPFTTDCGVINNSIVYTFAEVYGNDYETICEVVAQETAHSFGLDHEFLASDPMTYLDFNGLKTFQDQDVACGEFQARACGLPQQPVCRETQNSFALLTQRVGLGDAIVPTVAITSPANGDEVPPGFQITVDASDDQGITSVELYIDGTLLDTLTAPPYVFGTNSTLSIGAHNIETRAYDAKNVATSQIDVTIAIGAPEPQPGDDDDDDDDTGPGGNGAQPGSGGDLTGGCSTGGAGSGLGLAFLGLGLVFAVRRRRA
jgi:MYXO-CTERM domain-containing protein